MRGADVPRVGPLAGLSDGRAVLLAIIAITLFLYSIQIILLPFVLAGIVAYVCTPLIDALTKRTGLPRIIFAVLTFVVLAGIGAATSVLAVQHLAIELGRTIRELRATLDQLLRQASGGQPIHLFGYSIDGNQIVQSMNGRVQDWIAQPNHAALLAGASFSIVMGVVLTAVLLMWFLADGKSVARGLLWIVPPLRRRIVMQIWSKVDPVLKRYFVGVFAIVVYATVAAYVGLALILGLHHALLLALMTGIAETLPIVGSTAVAIIAGLVSLHTATGIMSIVAFALYATALRLSIDQAVAPLVLGRAANLHPVLIIFCFLAGAITFGITGVMLSVPVALTVKTALATVYGEDG